LLGVHLDYRKRELADPFQQVAHTQLDALQWRLKLHQGKGLGVNAFALPSGIIVLTDELVLAAKRRAS
jgi:hypothetical protein